MEGVKPISRGQARRLLDKAGMKQESIPRPGWMVPLDEFKWIENCAGELRLVDSRGSCRAVGLFIPTKDIGRYLRREGKYRNWE